MSDLISTLKQEHAELQRLLAEAKQHGISSGQGLIALAKAKRLLLTHLMKEDQELYPALKQLEAGRHIANSYADEMQQVSQDVLRFFQTLEARPDDRALPSEFGRLLGVLGGRIRKEESILYAKYEQLVDSDNRLPKVG